MLNCVSSTTLQSQPFCLGRGLLMESTENLHGWTRAVRPLHPKVNMDLQPMQDGEGGGAGVQPLLGTWPVASEQSLFKQRTVNSFSTHRC